VHREPQRRFQDLVLLHPHAEAQHHARHEARQLAGQLDAAAVHEQIDDGPVEALPPHGGERLPASADDQHAPALALEQPGDGTATSRITVDQQDVHACVRWEGIRRSRSNPRTTSTLAFSCTYSKHDVRIATGVTGIRTAARLVLSQC
jgi:hypothetical protein